MCDKETPSSPLPSSEIDEEYLEYLTRLPIYSVPLPPHLALPALPSPPPSLSPDLAILTTESEASPSSTEIDEETVFWRDLQQDSPPSTMMCNGCNLYKHTTRIAEEDTARNTLIKLAEAAETCKRDFKKIVRYGHFSTRLLHLVDSRACYRNWSIHGRHRAAEDRLMYGTLPRYRLIAEYNLCTTCVKVIESRVNEFYITFYPHDQKQPEEYEEEDK